MAVRRHVNKRDRMNREECVDIFEDLEDPGKDDTWNIATLFGLYLLQGIPLGLSAAIPLYLQSKNVTYAEQAKFSFVHWPFSMKLLWAPIVDSMYSARFGRRKSWLIPSQYLIGLFLLFLSHNVDTWLGLAPDITRLTIYFFLLNFLAATQDIVVDGWALTMLKRCNVAHASTCNSVGQTTGYFLGYVIFIALESPAFCNSFLRRIPQPYGLISLAGFLYFWGIVFLVTTTLILVLKRERRPLSCDEPEIPITKAYRLLWEIIRLDSMLILIIILLTSKMAFAACDAVTTLKLMEMGVTKEKLGGLAVLAIPVQIALPLVISKYLVGPKPMSLYIAAVPYRMWFSVMTVLVVWFAPYSSVDGLTSFLYYLFLIFIYLLLQIPVNIMYVAMMAFFARISDPTIGGTYMTLLNTVSNMGGNWPATVALWLVDSMGLKFCTARPNLEMTCLTQKEISHCAALGGTCEIWLDGYYVESIFCFVLGWIWLKYAKVDVLFLQDKAPSDWKVVRHR